MFIFFTHHDDHHYQQVAGKKIARCLICFFFLMLINADVSASMPAQEVEKSPHAAKAIIFPEACLKGESITIAAVGDVLLHRPLQEKASQKGFVSLWEAALPYLRQADIAYANLEGPMASGVTRDGREVPDDGHWNQRIYSDYPMFNYHPRLAKALVASGFHIVSTANNHALDRYGIGIDKTTQVLERAGLAFTGTRPRHSKASFISMMRKKNFTIAWIACTAHTNGIDDNNKQVLYCYKKSDRAWLIDKIKALKNQVDAVIVTPHFGEEYTQHQNAVQIQFAHQVLDAGALVVIGSHPHVLQPMEKYHTQDGRETFVIYSMGNFVSFQGAPAKRTTIILFVGLTKQGNRTVINGVQYLPMMMQNRAGHANLKLCPLTSPQKDAAAYAAFSRILPAGNKLDPLMDVVTNPQCR